MDLSQLGNVLSAASLLLAALSFIFGLWYPDIKKTLEDRIPDVPSERLPELNAAKQVFFVRALPLTLIAWLLAVVYLPPAFRILNDPIKIAKSGISTSSYDPVRASLLIIDGILICMAVFLTYNCYKIIRRYLNLKKGTKKL